ncbi:transglycosylase domain-containing protein [Actinomyces trachealis]|uniref:transglycosylase domain-containing protein n=1 Tax=Actinomyces trachealis TaxID=2763540 RepID=UPI001892A6F4|nr:transglycosylase domain-containing protein [Actinomyces trachealis]
MSQPTAGPGRPAGRKLAQAANAGRLPKRKTSSSQLTRAAATSAPPPGGQPTRSVSKRNKQQVDKPKGWRRVFNYPRYGKGPIRRWLPSWRFLLACFFLIVAAIGGVFAWAYSTINVPEPSEFAQAQTSTVYYADGTTVMGQFAEVDRTIIDTTKLPKYVGDAVVASEDRSFYTNKGVDPKGIVRALVNNLRGGGRQGASTLTQQYIKNYYVDTTSSYSGKFKQAIMAIKIDRQKSKSEILDSYLNTVYFGRGAYGIEAAAKAFFGVSAAELTPSQAALLAGIMPAPSAWDPDIDRAQAEQRWGRVMDFMAEDGYITDADRAAATAMPETISPKTDEVFAGPNGYLLQMVRKELAKKADLSNERVDTGGYKIVTTINKADQEAAVAAIANLPEGADPNLRAALVSIDVKTGGILALYGGKDYLTEQVNSATDAVAQAGSTFKPFAMVAALENGMTLANGYPGKSPIWMNGTRFENYENVSYGFCDLVKSTAYSVNTSYLQLNDALGANRTNEVAIRAGYPEDTVGMDTVVQSVLGSASPHTLDIATAYATFASGGTRRDSHIVGSVSNAGGSAVYAPDTTGRKVFGDGVMADATYAMQKVVEYGSGTTALALDRPVAGKTGSSSDNKSAQFVGFTPQVATAVTLYQSGSDGSEQSITPWGKYEEITGSTYPADIFTEYMRTALADLPVEKFPGRTDGSYRAGRLEGARSSNKVELPADEKTSAPDPNRRGQQQPEQQEEPAPEPTAGSLIPAPTPGASNRPEERPVPQITEVPSAAPQEKPSPEPEVTVPANDGQRHGGAQGQRNG